MPPGTTLCRVSFRTSPPRSRAGGAQHGRPASARAVLRRRARRRDVPAGIVLGGVLLLAVAAGWGVPEWSARVDAARHPVTAADLAAARDALAALPVRDRAPPTGYTREEFGPAWADVDGNGCDTRNDVLARDLVDVTFQEGTGDCVVLTGRLEDPYGGTEIDFRRGPRSGAVQIDHVVALADAWGTGGRAWPPSRREAFANDPANLLAVSGPLNVQKGADDAASWLPPAVGYRCLYAVRQVRVKAADGLWGTRPERDALPSGLGGGGGGGAAKRGGQARRRRGGGGRGP